MPSKWLALLHTHLQCPKVFEVSWTPEHLVVLSTRGYECLPSKREDPCKMTEMIQDFVFSQHLRLDPLSPFVGGRWVYEKKFIVGIVLLLRQHLRVLFLFCVVTLLIKLV